MTVVRKLRLMQPARVFSPADIAGLVGWWDASDVATITEAGGDVSQWDDKSTSGIHLVQAAANKPGTGLTTQNGLNVLTIASGDYLQKTGTSICATAHTIFAVWRKTGAAQAFESGPISLSASNGTGRPLDAYNALRYVGGASYTGTYTDMKTATSWGQITWLGAKGTPNTLTERLNGAVVSSGTATSIDFSTTGQIISAGTRGGGFTIMIGNIAEIVIYDVVLGGTDLTDVEDYLQAKWGTP